MYGLITLVAAALMLIGSGCLVLSIKADSYRNDHKRNVLMITALTTLSVVALVLILTGDLV